MCRLRAIEDFTGFPEMMDGRVKTLHPRLYAGLLAVRDNDGHLRAAAEHAIEPVDLVCVNLYPFEQTVARGDATPEEIVENIDIGGPTMIRAAAKNSAFAAVVVDPADYEAVLAELRRVRRQAVAVHSPAPCRRSPSPTTARYDAAISSWFAQRDDEDFPRGCARSPTRRRRSCATARTRTSAPPTTPRGARRRTCSPVSDNCTARSCRSTTCSTSASARELVEDFSRSRRARSSSTTIPAAVRSGRPSQDAYERAFASDPVSAYGGVIALNRPVDVACAQALSKQFIEVLLAPASSPRRLRS